jgi:hypothetical protein
MMKMLPAIRETSALVYSEMTAAAAPAAKP